MFASLCDKLTLSNRIKIPCVGFGTYLTPDGDVCSESVKTALETGYRHIDTAEFYANESSVGRGIALSGLAREDVFVTTKLWNINQGYETTLRSFEASLKKLGIDYLDLYLIHWPVAHDFKEDYPKHFLATWKAFEKLYADGLTRAIGVCNCMKKHLITLLDNCSVAPTVNQIEYHIGLMQEETVEFSKANDIAIEAWAPLCRGRAFGSEPLKSIAGSHGKTEAQILLRWCLQHETIPLPKSVTPSRIRENADIFDFSLNDNEMAALDAFEGVGRIGSHPDTVKF